MGVTGTIENWEFSIANFQSSRVPATRSSARSDMFIENDGLEKSHQLRRSGMSLTEPDRANMSNSMPLLRSLADILRVSRSINMSLLTELLTPCRSMRGGHVDG